MPAELPGLYFDPEKNRYFPIKHRTARAGQICETKATSSGLSQNEPHKRKRTNKFGAVNLLSRRELAGRLLPSSNCSSICFQREYMESQVSFPKVWMYENTIGRADGAVEQFVAIMETPEGTKQGDVLTVGGKNGCLGFYEVDETKQQLEHDQLICRLCPFVRPNSGVQNPTGNQPSPIWSRREPSMAFQSNITAIKTLGKRSAFTNYDGVFLHEGALFTTLGSRNVGGSLYVLRLNKPMDFNESTLHRRVSQCISTNCTIWTADSSFDGTKAIIGTNRGADLVDIERGTSSWVCRSNSDILSQQFDQSGNLIFCGCRNGAILTVDIRKEQSSHFGQSASERGQAIHRSSHIFSSKNGAPHSLSGKFRVRGNVNPSDAIYMPSAVCSLAVLHSDDKYLLASSMNGIIKLWDQRLTQRGAVQSYEGHINSHTMIQIGVDPTETLLASGGEDCAVRLWSVKSGKLLHTATPTTSPVTTVCWPRHGKLRESFKVEQFYEDTVFEQNFCWGLWLGSSEGLLYMHGGG